MRVCVSFSHHLSPSPLGELSVRARVDYESVTRLELDVTAFDTGVPQRNSTARLVIGVVNVNDMTPEFEQVRDLAWWQTGGLGTNCVPRDIGGKQFGREVTHLESEYWTRFKLCFHLR